MSDATSAIFISYAREDSVAADRIAEALRSHGIEVWFDQNELRGGEAWDQKIRGQIRSCSLLIPIVSAHTQGRGEGYFRREWKLAAERTHDMAAGIPFLVPVVIDDTAESAALVPEEFMKVQWTRLPHGRTTPQFAAQVKRLLEAPRGAVAKVEQASPPAVSPSAGGTPALPRAVGRRVPVAAWAGVLAVIVIAALAWQWLRHPAAESSAGLRQDAAATPGKATVATPAPPPAAAKSAPTEKSIAVLPFANLSADKENEFFADGMHDDLITALAKIRDLKVISRTSVMPYKTGERNLRKIAAELGVATVLEGSVQRAGSRVRLNVQLIDARTDGHLWAETYSKDLTDVFAMQAALTQEIATALKATLTPGERTLITRRPTENQQAYDLYLRARIIDQTLQVFSSKEEYERVVSFYEQAAELDPAFTLAHVQASISHGTMFWFAALDPTPARRARALAALEKARALAPGSPEVRMAQGSYEYLCHNNWSGALEEYDAAELGLPNDAQLQYRMALAHRRVGEFHKALVRLERCAALNPNDTRGITTLIETVMGLRRYPQVVESYHRYHGLFTEDYGVTRQKLLAEQELTGDWPAFLRGMSAVPPRANDRFGLDAAYKLALNAGNLAEADRILADPRWQVVSGSGGIVNEPIALHRANLAWLLGRPDAAVRFADAAIAYYRNGSWSARQQPVVQMGVALAEAFAGRTEVALREGRAAQSAQDALEQWGFNFIRHSLGQVLVVTGHKEEALEQLRLIMRGYGTLSSGEIRHDPIWSRLKDDPRFEEILRSAKPL